MCISTYPHVLEMQALLKSASHLIPSASHGSCFCLHSTVGDSATIPAKVKLTEGCVAYYKLRFLKPEETTTISSHIIG